MRIVRAAPPRPWLTAQDVREAPHLISAQHERLSAIPCEHSYFLTDSCPGCDATDEVLEEATAAQRAAYFSVVSWGAVHLTPRAPRRDTVQALARLDLLVVRYLPPGAHPPVGRRRWTAAPHIWVEELCAAFPHTTEHA